MTTLNSLKWILVFFGMIFCYKFIRLERTVSILETKIEKYKTVNKINTAVARASQDCYTLPEVLQRIPLADGNLLLDVKNLPIRNIYAPYNASIIEKENGYYLLFRYDLVTNMHINGFHSKIGMVELDDDLNQTEKEFAILNTKSNYSEDPRAFKFGEEYYIAYNDYLPNIGGRRRGIYLAQLNREKNEIINQRPLEIFMNQFEKNWSPFVKVSEDTSPKLYFEYQIASPRKILEKTVNSVKQISRSNLQNSNDLEWVKKWGLLRGGTPAQLINGEYLAFFHSSFRDKSGCYWYVLGAYTFEKNAPFKMTRISPYPILFKGIYDTRPCNTAEARKKVIFPSGFVQARQSEREIFYLSCGENDCAIKILTLDKEALLKSLKQIE